MKVGEFLDFLKSKARVPIRTRVDPSLLRPADVTLQIPNVDKFHAATGWRPKISFEDSVSFLLEYWRRRVSTEGKAMEKAPT